MDGGCPWVGRSLITAVMVVMGEEGMNCLECGKKAIHHKDGPLIIASEDNCSSEEVACDEWWECKDCGIQFYKPLTVGKEAEE